MICCGGNYGQLVMKTLENISITIVMIKNATTCVQVRIQVCINGTHFIISN